VRAIVDVMATATGTEKASGLRTLDARQLTLSSLSSVLGGVVGAALGGGVAMTFVGMAVTPWLTAFVEYPGPYRRRRVTLVVLFAATVFMSRWLLDYGGLRKDLEYRSRAGRRGRGRARSPRSLSLGAASA
jgi:hypothetical protein